MLVVACLSHCLSRNVGKRWQADLVSSVTLREDHLTYVSFMELSVLHVL